MNEDNYISEHYESYIKRALQERADSEAMWDEYCKYLDLSDTDEMNE